MASTPKWQAQSLRVYVAGKLCSGFSYGVSFDSPAGDDCHFPHRLADGTSLDVIVDPESIKFIDESVVDWVDDQRGSGFLVENPGHKKFRGKFFRAKNWQRRLS